MDEHFFLNSKTYEKNYKQVFYKRWEYQSRYVIQYLVVLPFELSFSENTIISFFQNKEIYAFSFSRTEEEQSYTAGTKGEPDQVKYNVTRVEMSLFTNSIYYLTEQMLTDIFDRLLDNLNSIITSYLIKTKQDDIYKISKEMLEPFCLYRLAEVPEFKSKDKGLFLLHPYVAYKKDLLEVSKQREIVEYSNVVRNKLNPFLLTEELMIDARRNLKSGFYKEAIINAQTSIETLLRTLYKEMLIIEGFTEKEIEKKQEQGFITVIKKEFSKRIGGSWDVTNSNKAVGRWHENCYEIRNRVVHGGYHPNYLEADRGVSSAQILREFVVKRLSQTKKYHELVEFL